MNAGARVGGFLAGLVVVGLVGAGLGAVVGPVDTAPAGHDAATPAHGDDHAAAATSPSGGTVPGGPGADGGPGAGAGYRLDLAPLGATLDLRVLDGDGLPVVATEVRHTEPLHLIVVGRDLVTYAHLHPVADDGTWSAPAPDLPPGSYRVVADLVPEGGPELALAADLTVPGPTEAVAVPPVAPTATVDDLVVTLAGTPTVGDTDLAFTVRRGDEVVTPEPYLGARGHLVAFRTSDLAYSHVHPHDGEGATQVAFTAAFPSTGTYRLFLDLRVDGTVHTAAFTVAVPGPDGPASTTTRPADGPNDGPSDTSGTSDTSDPSDPSAEGGHDHDHG